MVCAHSEIGLLCALFACCVYSSVWILDSQKATPDANIKKGNLNVHGLDFEMVKYVMPITLKQYF